MKKKILSCLLTLCMLATIIAVLPITANAETEVIYSYDISNGYATIICCDTSASGSITIPSTLGGYPVTSIGDLAFYSCTSLTSITIPNSVTSIGYGAFYDCDSLTSITIPDSVTSIGDDAFYECSSLKSITIPDSVTSIGVSAFCGCDSLTSITIPDSVTSIGDNAFSCCSRLKSITIPDSVTSIGDRAFSYCGSLTSITIPDSVTSIGDDAFLYCDSLSLTSITIPDSVTSIGDRAFSFCYSLTNITVSENNKYYCSVDGNLFNKNKNELIQYAIGKKDTSYIIPSSVTSIGNGAFCGCYRLTSITIPDSVTSIGDDAFYICTSLTSITIPDSVTSIGNGAFDNCRSLTSITIPDSVTSIGDRAFSFCYSLTDVYYIGNKEQWENINIGSNNKYLTNANIHYITPININYVINSNGSVWKTTTSKPSTDFTLTTDTPIRTGHTFLGWATTADAAVAEYQPGDTITADTKDMNLYAVWEKTTYTKTKKVNGIFMITPTGVPTGSSIMLACYKGGELVHIGKFEYDGSAAVPFFVNEEYDEVKVLVWSDVDSMVPVTEAEDVNI